MESLEEVLSSYTAGLGVFEGGLRQIRGALRALTEAPAGETAAATATETATATAAATAAAANGNESAAELPPLEAAQLHVATAFAACTLWFGKPSRV